MKGKGESRVERAEEGRKGTRAWGHLKGKRSERSEVRRGKSSEG